MVTAHFRRLWKATAKDGKFPKPSHMVSRSKDARASFESRTLQGREYIDDGAYHDGAVYTPQAVILSQPLLLQGTVAADDVDVCGGFVTTRS